MAIFKIKIANCYVPSKLFQTKCQGIITIHKSKWFSSQVANAMC